MAHSASFRSIFTLWFPLLLTWLLMAFEGPFLAGIIARMPEAKINLAAFGVAFAVALILESPIINMLAASVKVVSNRATYLLLRNFNGSIVLGATLCTLLVLYPPVYEFWAGTLLALETEVSERTYWCLVALIPWPATIGYRRFYQGILIKQGKSRLVTLGTAVRLSAMVGGALVIYKFFPEVPGAALGGLGLSIGVTAEAIVSRILAGPSIKLIWSMDDRQDTGWDISSLIRFYYPLATTTLIGLAIAPTLTFAAGHGISPLESLAVIPVINAFIFVFRAVALSLQEVIIAVMDKSHDPHLAAATLGRYAFLLGGICTGVYILVVVTPLYEFWFRDLLGLSPELLEFSYVPLLLVGAVPPLTVLLNWQRSLLIFYKDTLPLSHSSAIELIVVVIILIVGLALEVASAAAVIMLSLSISRIVSTTYLQYALTRHSSGRPLAKAVLGG